MSAQLNHGHLHKPDPMTPNPRASRTAYARLSIRRDSSPAQITDFKQSLAFSICTACTRATAASVDGRLEAFSGAGLKAIHQNGTAKSTLANTSIPLLQIPRGEAPRGLSSSAEASISKAPDINSPRSAPIPAWRHRDKGATLPIELGLGGVWGPTRLPRPVTQPRRAKLDAPKPGTPGPTRLHGDPPTLMEALLIWQSCTTSTEL